MSTSLDSLASLQSSTTPPTTTITPFTSVRSSTASVAVPGHAPSRSLSFTINKDKLSSLVRTRSARTSSKKQETVTDAQFLKEHASQLPSNSTTMTSREHEVLPRKSENKLFQFFTSRSRSRSKARSQSVDAPITGRTPPLPVAGPSSHARHASLDDYDTSARYPPFVPTSPKTYASFNTGASGNRPATRSQSRPLSTTTTATHSTITSLVGPTQRRPMTKKYGSGGRSIGRPASTSSSLDIPLDAHPSSSSSPYASPPSSSQYHSPPPESTPQGSLSSSASKPPTSTRMRLQNLFGIPLSNSRRSSMGSRATTPNSNKSAPSSTPPPPLPTSSRYANLRSTLDSRPSTSQDVRRATSPLGRARAEAGEQKEKRRSATAPATWLTPRFFSSSGSTVDHSRRSASSRSRSPSPPRAPLVAVNPDSTSSLHTQTTHTHAESIHEPERDRGIGSSMHAPWREDAPPVPVIMHTPPTPQKGNGSERGSVPDGVQRRSLGSPRNSSHAGHARNRSQVVVGESSLDGLVAGMASPTSLGHQSGLESTSEVSYGHAAPADVDPEANIRRGRWSPRFFGGDSSRARVKERDQDAEREREREKARTKLSASSRVGSPVDGRTTPSSVTNSSSGRHGRSKHGNFDFESTRPTSATSARTAIGVRNGRVIGIGPAMAKSKARDAHDVAVALPISGNGASKLERSVSFSDPHVKHKRSHNREPQQPSHSPRTHLHALPEAEQPTPPVPTQPISLPHSAHARKASAPPPGGNMASSWGRATTTTQTPTVSGGSKRRAGGLGLTHGSFPFEPAVSPSTSPCTSEFGIIRSEDSGYGESSTTTTSTTNGVATQRRAKGRSLDLHLGLSWAPTKVKPEAIMSSFSSRGKERRGEERRKFEDGVNEVFKDVLGEAGYATFRKYIRRFDARSIPFEGPGGLMIRVEKLLDAAPPPRLHEREKLELLDRFIKVVLNTSEDSR